MINLAATAMWSDPSGALLTRLSVTWVEMMESSVGLSVGLLLRI